MGSKMKAGSDGRNSLLEEVLSCYKGKIDSHGNTPEGVYWNSIAAQEIRFAQLIKVCDLTRDFSLIDYGCGYGALADYLHNKNCTSFTYTGYDILPEMISSARDRFSNTARCRFTSVESSLETADYAVASGIFNLKMRADESAWEHHVLKTLDKMNHLSNKGFSFNLLTSYSDPEKMRPDLYYADPCFFFDYCKRNYSRNVALLHDYDIYDFTILVRKEL